MFILYALYVLLLLMADSTTSNIQQLRLQYKLKYTYAILLRLAKIS